MKVLTKILVLIIVFGISMIILEMNKSYGSVSISVSPASVHPGDQITVTVRVSGAAAWNIHVYAEGPVSGGSVRLVGDSPDGNNTSSSATGTFTATGTGTIRFYTSGSDITINQDGNGVYGNANASNTVSVTERPAPAASTNTQQSTSTAPRATSTPRPTNTPKPNAEEDEEGLNEEDFEAAQRVIDMIHALDITLESYADDVAAAREAYELLTDEQKELVLNYEELVLAEGGLKEEEIEEVEEKAKREPIIVSMPLAAFIGLQAGIIVLELGVIIGLKKYITKKRNRMNRRI